jgi:hypothetical protein
LRHSGTLAEYRYGRFSVPNSAKSVNASHLRQLCWNAPDTQTRIGVQNANTEAPQTRFAVHSMPMEQVSRQFPPDLENGPIVQMLSEGEQGSAAALLPMVNAGRRTC